jgi:hypothetical protein
MKLAGVLTQDKTSKVNTAAGRQAVNLPQRGHAS